MQFVDTEAHMIKLNTNSNNILLIINNSWKVTSITAESTWEDKGSIIDRRPCDKVTALLGHQMAIILIQ